MITIVDYGMGNLRSVCSAVEMSGSDVEIVDSPNELMDAQKIILPGVGAFRDCINSLKEKGLAIALYEKVMVQRVPILGICLGMQVMAKKSYEGGEYEGLGWIDAEVVKISDRSKVSRTVHMGWNDISCEKSFLFEGLPEKPDVYFVHSYYMDCVDKSDVIASCQYEGAEMITAAVCKGNICCTQFHPEKSQTYGLKILENFIDWTP